MTNTFHWLPEHVATIGGGPTPEARAFSREELPRLIPGVDLWDHWPVLERGGRPAEIAGGQLIVALSAPILGDPDARHAVARLRLLHHSGDTWRDLGILFPDDLSAGSREWAGSAVIDHAHEHVMLYFTAAGVAGEAAPSFGQRMFATRALVAVDGDDVSLDDWSGPVELVRPDGATYEADMAGGGAIGTIKAFRDPFAFHDPATGRDHLVFAASRAQATSDWNGVVGHAIHGTQGWTLQPPLVDATGLNNELERPHLVAHDGRYLLFWSTQRRTFEPAGPKGPNGLYGLVGTSPTGPWRPLNGSGLVFGNPASAPCQAYSWQVLDDLSVLSFADSVGLDRLPYGPAEAREHFGGVPAPTLRLTIDGDRATLV